MSDLIGKRLGQYEITALLGEGGMSSVYRARQTSVGRDVAVKVIESPSRACSKWCTGLLIIVGITATALIGMLVVSIGGSNRASALAAVPVVKSEIVTSFQRTQFVGQMVSFIGSSTPTVTSGAASSPTRTPTQTPTSTLPPLRSDKYVNDRSFLSQVPCGPPCFHNITVGQTTFLDALSKIRANPLFSNVQSQDYMPQAIWDTSEGVACCQLTADYQTGVVDAILLHVAPVMTLKEVIDKYGTPAYVSVLPQDYSETEVALGLIYPKTGNVVWVMPGDANSAIDENDPVVIILYLDPAKFDELLATATLQGWDGYKTYSFYRTVTPALTPRVTLTPSQ